MKITKTALAISIVLSLVGCSDDSEPQAKVVVESKPRPLENYDTLTPTVPVQRPLEDYDTLTPTVPVLRPLENYEGLLPGVDVVEVNDTDGDSENESANTNDRNIEDLETLTPTVRPIPEGLMPTVDISFDIPNKYVIDSYPIEREYTNAFTLDNISVSYNAADGNYTITNETPRYINNPTLLIDGVLYRLETYLEPFQHQTFLYRSHTDELAQAIDFVDEQPFFKSKINGYTDLNANPEFRLATAEEALRFEEEFRAHKSAANDFSLTAHIAEYITSYGVSTRSAKFNSLSFDYTDCPYDDHDHTHPMARTGTDDSEPYVKLLSYLNHQPTAQHLITLNGGVNGVATIGNGWLALRSHRIYSEGRVEPFSTFLHEKMHTHRFGHAGGMTYGVPDVIINYRRNNDALRNYYESEKLAMEIPKAVVKTDFEFDGDYIITKFRFFSQREEKIDLVNSISRFMLVLPEGIDEENVTVSIVEGGLERNLSPTLVSAKGKVLAFEEDYELGIEKFNAQFNDLTNYISVRMLSPTTSQTFSVLASGHEGDWAIQANKIVEIGADIGLNTGDGRFVFYANNKGFDEETGLLVEALAEYTPEEAEQICIDKGFSGLGVLDQYKSTEQMNFQMAYLPYKSQVGIDPDTLEPVAVMVESSYRPEFTYYVDTGSLVVCQ